jgi:hypothetical protein
MAGQVIETENIFMKYLSLIPVAVFSLAQMVASQTAAVSSVDAELTKRIDAKKAKVGDAVEAKVTTAVKLTDGTELPKGTKVEGKVTDVRAKSNADKTSHLAFNLTEAVTKDGHEIPLRVMVTSIAAPVDTPPDVSSIAGGSRGGATTPDKAGSAPPPSNPSGPYVTQSAINNGMQPLSGANGAVARAPNDRVPVGNLPGVVLTSADGTSSAAALDAMNQNVALDPGTKLTLRVSAQK